MVDFVTNNSESGRMSETTPTPPEFDLAGFLPYMLNQAAEAASEGFSGAYRAEYGMLRTEWRVLFHLGRYGAMTATEIGARARIHKTKISRAVAALERKRFLKRSACESDRRAEMLALTALGDGVFGKLTRTAAEYDRALSARFTAEEQRILRKCLRDLAGP
jgi:DNA-binding MarR family transcriptional regulator